MAAGTISNLQQAIGHYQGTGLSSADLERKIAGDLKKGALQLSGPDLVALAGELGIRGTEVRRLGVQLYGTTEQRVPAKIPLLGEIAARFAAMSHGAQTAEIFVAGKPYTTNAHVAGALRELTEGKATALDKPGATRLKGHVDALPDADGFAVANVVHDATKLSSSDFQKKAGELIAQSAIDEMMARLGVSSMEGREVAVLGYGKIGSTVAEKLAEGGAKVRVVEPDARHAATIPKHMQQQSINEVLGSNVPIIDCTGHRAIPESMLESSPQPMISASSKHLGANRSTDGWPQNFDGSVPSELIAQTQLLLAQALLEAGGGPKSGSGKMVRVLGPAQSTVDAIIAKLGVES
jgi:hypothetical protein